MLSPTKNVSDTHLDDGNSLLNGDNDNDNIPIMHRSLPGLKLLVSTAQDDSSPDDPLTHLGEPPTFAEVDNLGNWSECTFRPKFTMN